MSSTTISLLVFTCIFSSALLGIYLRYVLPESHLKDDTLSVVKLATGLIATMSALVLSLLISSAKGSFDRINNELVENSAKILAADRLLRDYGPETEELRELIKREYTAKVAILTSGDAAQLAKLYSPEGRKTIEMFQRKLLTLVPRDELQRTLRERILQLSNEFASARELVFLQKDGTIPMPMLFVLAAWLSIIFAAFGLCAPRNRTTVAALLVTSICAAGAVFLILEMDRPLDGLISLRAAPLHAAVDQLGH